MPLPHRPQSGLRNDHAYHYYSCAVLLRFGLSGTTGMFFVMAIAGMVCTRYPSRDKPSLTSKSATGWARLPRAGKVKFLGVIAAAIAAGLTIVMLARTFQFGEALPGDLRPVWLRPKRRS